MANGFKNFDYTYGVGMEFKATSAKQVKDLLKTNLDNLSKLVKDYNKVLKIDPNADLSKLFSEMQKLKGVVDGINNSDNLFAGFVDKGLLGRIASLENGLQSVSAISNEVKANMNGLRETITSVIEPLKTSGQIKFPATFDNLFGDVSDQTGKIKNIQNQIKTLETEAEKVSTILTDIDQALEGKSSKGKGETDKNKIIAWADQYRILSEKLKQNLRPEELSQVVQEYGNAAVHLNNAMRTMKDATMQELNLTGLRGSITKDFKFIVDALDNYIVELDGKTDGLEGELEKLEAIQEKHVAKTSARNKSLGIAKNEDGSNLTLRAKIIPDTDEAAWVKKINDTIKNIEPQLASVKLTPTFSKSSKNIDKEVEGNLAQINHAVKVDLQVTDNIEQFNQKIQNIDKSIKNAKSQLEKEGNFKIKFEYEEGGKFKDVAYKIINQFKNIEAKIHIANGKKFLQDIARLRENATTKLKDIPANVVVGNQDSMLASIDTLRSEIEQKIGNIGVNLNIQNLPQFVAQAAMMRDGVEKYYNDNPVGVITGPSTSTSGIENAANEMNKLSDAAKKANEDLEKSKKILKSLTESGFNSKEFLQLGDINANGKKIKGSTEKLEKLLNRYKELQAKLPDDIGERWQELYPDANGDIHVARKMALEVKAELKQVESELQLYLQKQIAYAQSRYEQAEKVLQTEKEISATTSKTVDNSQTSSDTKGNQQLAMSAEEATKKIRSLNGTLVQQKRVLKDLETNKFNSSSFVKLGEWDKETNSFKKNSQEMQQLIKRYKELREARLATGGKTATGEEASIRGKLSAILREQKKHVTEIIAKNQEELASVKKISAAYKQSGDNKAKSVKTNVDIESTTKKVDELTDKLNKAQSTLSKLKSGDFNVIGSTGLGDVKGRLKNSTQSFKDLITVYNRLIAAQKELEKHGKTGTPGYVQNANILKGIEQQMQIIYEDQLKYTQSRIKSYEKKIAQARELLQVENQQTKEDERQAGASTNKKVDTTTSGATSTTVKLDSATLNSLAKDSTLKSIDGKINNILTQLGNGVVINGSNISIEASNVSVSGKGASSGGSTKGTGEQEVKLSTISSYSQQLISLEERIKRTGLYTDDLKQKFADLYTQLNAIKVRDDADTYKFDLDRFKEDFEQLKTYDKLYQDFIKSQAKQIQLNDQIATSNGPTAALQEQLKIEEEVSRNIETQLEKYTTLYNQRTRQLAIDEAIKKANQEITKSSATQSDKDVNKQNSELIKIVDNAQKQYNEMQYSMSNFKVPMTDSAIAKLKEYEQLLGILKQKQQEIMDNPDLLKNPDYSKSFSELLLRMQGVQNQFTTLQKSSESFLSKIKSIDDIKPLDATFDANNLAQLHNEMQAFANQTGKGTAKLIEFNDVNRTATFEIQNGKGQVQQLTIAYDEATNSLGRFASKTKESLSESQKFFNSLRHSFQNVARYIASFGSVYRLFAIIKQGVTYVREIDTALTELKKVTDETDAAYEQFLQDMSKTAGVVGSTVKDLTTMSAEWARLGSIIKSAPLYSNIY